MRVYHLSAASRKAVMMRLADETAATVDALARELSRDIQFELPRQAASGHAVRGCGTRGATRRHV